MKKPNPDGVTMEVFILATQVLNERGLSNENIIMGLGLMMTDSAAGKTFRYDTWEPALIAARKRLAEQPEGTSSGPERY